MPQPEPKDPTPTNLMEWLGYRRDHSLYRYRRFGLTIAHVLEAFVLVAVIFAMISAIVVMFGTTRDVLTGQGAGPNLGAGALIAAILGAPFVIWSTVLKHQTLRYQKEGHITERISKAVEQLGAEKTVKKDGAESTEPNIEVRIGAILSLERIAQDSTTHDHGRDHVRVMEILCAYIRENAPASKAKDHDFGEWEPMKDKPSAKERAAHKVKRLERFGGAFIESKVYKWSQSLPEPRADIAIALRVIGRRDAQQRLVEARWGKDARATDIWVFDTPCPALPDDEGPTSKAALEAYRAELDAWKEKIGAYRGYRLDLRGTNLQRADLSDLALSGARLNGARVEGAYLSEARMEGAYLSGARMEGADLSEARMEWADLREARMEGADLTRARMEVANPCRARMEGADLTRARMEGADLSWARMEGAVLSAARMEGADLTLARMDAATDLTGAVVSKATVRYVDYSGVRISMDQVKSMFGDATVTLPNGITPASPDWPAHWPKFELDWDDFSTEYEKWRADPTTYTPPDPPQP